MMCNKLLGNSVCSFCGGSVDLRESKKEKAYYACGDCNVQVFARGAKSDQLLRKKAVVSDNDMLAPDVIGKVESEKKGGLMGWLDTDD